MNTAMTSSSLEKFQSLLRELFQFDCADLDFGIYRIMNHKRDVVEKWITETLPARVEAELRTGALRADSSTADRLEELKDQIIGNLGPDALDGDGNLIAAFQGTTLGKQYLELRKAAEHAIGGGDQRAIVFNHLYQFFSHYYDSGDFLSLRRYSARQKYAIPYNGEEVHLHWANADQYYIKTSEYFTDYRWKAAGAIGDEGFTVLFKLRNAEQETGNNKANEKRYFCFSPEELEYDEATRTLTLPAAYRALDKEEAKAFTGNGDKPQQMLGEAAIAGVRAHALVAKNASLKAAILAPARNSAGQPMVDSQTKEPVPLLLKHLRTYARRNNSDFFIHKDLSGFLTRELDFYLKNEVLSLDTLLAGGPRPSEGWFQLLHVIKTLGNDIIAFLAQLENFQKTLFEKKKFVTDCHWCLTLDRVSASLLPEITANGRQWDQWEDLHKIFTIEPKAKTWAKGKDPEKALAWLKSMPFLMVDTSLFKDSDFQDRLLATLPDIEGQMDGLLVNAENFQGLRLLAARFSEQIQTIYIDPPYNTGGDGFVYKDSYQHSSWISMIQDRLQVAFDYLSPKGVLFSSIDTVERINLEHALNSVFDVGNRIEEIIWVQNTTKNQSPTYSTNHEYVEVYARFPELVKGEHLMFRETKPGYLEIMEVIDELNPKFPPLADVETALKELYKAHRAALKAEEADLDEWKGIYNYNHAEYRDEKGRYIEESNAETAGARIWVWREVDVSMPQVKQDSQKPEFKDPKSPTYRFYTPPHPVTGMPCPAPSRGWSWPYLPHGNQKSSFSELAVDKRIAWGLDEKKIPQRKSFLHEVETNVAKSVVNDYTDGEKELANLFGQTRTFGGPKPTTLIQRFCDQSALGSNWFFDFFAGSGTSGQAVLAYNREKRTRGRMLLMEAGRHFDSILKPRIAKTVFSADWKEGMALTQNTGISHAFKVIRLETYEDALANIEFSHQIEGELFTKQVGPEYLLKYALEFETQGSATRLCPEALTAPFDYQLNLFDGTETRSKRVDLPETFHYLIGLKVATRRWIERKAGKVTHRYLHVTGTANGDGKRVTVLWRTVPAGWKEADYQAEKEWAREAKLFEGADRSWYNGPGTLLDAQPLDSEFRRLLFA